MTIIAASRKSIRSLIRQPGFTLPAVLTLGLSIGIATAVFSVLYGVLLQQLPYTDPDRLVLVWETDVHNTSPREGASLPDFRDWQEQSTAFAALSAVTNEEMTLTGPGLNAERINAGHVTHDLFATLGVTPVLGHGFTAADDQPNSAPLVILSHNLWQSRFSGNPAILGRPVRLESVDYTVVGVMPRGFGFPDDTQVWTALEPHLHEFQRLRGVHSLGVIGRLRTDATVASAQEEMTGIAKRLEKTYPDDNAGRGAFVEPMHASITGTVRPVLYVLFAAALLVMIIGCANVAGLMFVRVGQREKELSVRVALGATRRDIALQVLGESLLVSLAGSLAGVALASWGVKALLALAPDTLPRREAIALHVPVLLFAVGLAFAACLVSGLLPALSAARRRAQNAIPSAAARLTDGRDAQRSRRLLIVAELAVAVVLTIGAMLLLRSYRALAQVDIGVTHLDLITANIRFPEGKYPTPSRKEYPRWPQAFQLYDRILEQTRAIPGVTSVAIALNHPLRRGWTSQATIVGRPVQEGPKDEVRIRPVTAGYARTVGLPLLAGRDIEPQDRLDAEDVLLINQAMVDKYFPGQNPIGHEVTFWGTPRRVVGVVGNERFLGLQEDVEPAVYPSLYQVPLNDFYLVLRSDRSLAQMLPDLRGALAAIDRDIPLTDPQTLDTLVSRALAPQRFTTVLLSIFGGLALLLAAVGVFGLIAYQVSLRLRELGIRIALGAERKDLMLLVVREAIVLALIAVVIGCFAAVWLTHFLDRFLFGVSALDPSAFVLSAVVLACVGLIAGTIPAIRASRVDPMVVLRAE